MKYKSYKQSEDFSTHIANISNFVEIDKSLLKKLLSLQAPSRYESEVQNFVWDWVEENVPEARMVSDANGNIYIVKGEDLLYPCVVAHMDEVNDFSTDRTILELGNLFIGMNAHTGEAAGCPGDDRCGVYTCLELLRLVDNIKVALFVEEEIGAMAGSGSCSISFFDDVAFILQADRNGNDEIITQTNGLVVASKDFKLALLDIMESYDYHFSSGTFTDVGVLAERGVGVSCINIGSGYYDAHSAEEKVCISDVENTLNLMYRICNELSYYRWLHDATKIDYKKEYNSSNWRQSKYGIEYGSEDDFEFEFDIKVEDLDKYLNQETITKNTQENKTSTNKNKKNKRKK